MFGIFGKKASHSLIQFTDLNFLSGEAKDRAVLGSARENNAVFVAWFPATVNHYRKLFAGSGGNSTSRSNKVTVTKTVRTDTDDV